ncbi:putative reverse transcriptase domain-containing protein [Tanacetum coccineum]|uniref:Reverse transcriptase domain-containing protein n=1 Tax=Tanacetum coccineum TaxID=301880 RepID=A0ABQ4XHG9_9ASTR
MHGEQPAGKKDNTKGLGFGSGVLPLVDDTVKNGDNDLNVHVVNTNNVNLETPLASNRGDDFSSKDGLNAMLENGPWFIRINPLILKKWDPDVNLFKEDVTNVPVWVKLHDVHMMAFIEDGLSAIATKLGTPLMLDSYTSDVHAIMGYVKLC